MRLYTRTGAIALTDPATGIEYKADERGGFNFPNEFSDRLHGFAVGGKPMWESDVERQRRLMAEEVERRKDPAALLSVMEQLVQAATTTAAPAAAEAPAPVAKAPAKRASKRAASVPSAE